MKNAEMELYTDYLLSTFGPATATGLSQMLEGDVSHDRITRLLVIHPHFGHLTPDYVRPRPATRF